MRFTLLFVAVALALSANATSLDRRSISAPVQVCRDDMDTISLQIDAVTAILEGFVGSSGYAGVLAVRNQEQILESNLNEASADCCPYMGVVTDEDAEAMLSTVSPVIPKAVYALSLVKSKKAEFTLVNLSLPIVRSSLASLNSQTVNLYDCFLSIATEQHPSYVPIINDYMEQLDFAFSNARGAYGTV